MRIRRVTEFNFLTTVRSTCFYTFHFPLCNFTFFQRNLFMKLVFPFPFLYEWDSIGDFFFREFHKLLLRQKWFSIYALDSKSIKKNFEKRTSYLHSLQLLNTVSFPSDSVFKGALARDWLFEGKEQKLTLKSLIDVLCHFAQCSHRFHHYLFPGKHRYHCMLS